MVELPNTRCKFNSIDTLLRYFIIVTHKERQEETRTTSFFSFSYRCPQLVQNSASEEKRDDNRDSNEEVEPSADVPDNTNGITHII